MKLLIEIGSTEVATRSGVSSRTGKPYNIAEQTAWLHREGQQYPDKIRISLEQGQMPYQPGNYDLHPSSFYVDKFGSLAVRPVLISRPAEQRAPAPAPVRQAQASA
jgi:hypothetical protein